MDFLKNHSGVLKSKVTAQGIHLQIEGEMVAEQILKEIVGKGFIRKFELEEPSLNDIFIEKVGDSYE